MPSDQMSVPLAAVQVEVFGHRLQPRLTRPSFLPSFQLLAANHLLKAMARPAHYHYGERMNSKRYCQAKKFLLRWPGNYHSTQKLHQAMSIDQRNLTRYLPIARGRQLLFLSRLLRSPHAFDAKQWNELLYEDDGQWLAQAAPMFLRSAQMAYHVQRTENVLTHIAPRPGH